MKSLLFATLGFALCIYTSHAQVYCDGIRYNNQVFASVDTLKDVIYGSSITNSGTTLILKMDVFKPSGDTAALRPLIILAHGGSFVSGTKKDFDVATLCNRFAKMGYVTASIDYRLGISTPFNQANTTLSVMRAVQDMKASVRYFYMDAQNGNSHKVDTSQIWIGGSSAGAITALHMGYLDKTIEVPTYIDTTLVGGFEGLSGNSGYSTKVKGVINLCGALGEKRWLESNDLPLVSVHGTNDNIVPYGSATLYLLQVVPIMPVDGSGALDLYADSIQTESDLKTFYGAGHVPYTGSTSYMDSTVNHVKSFLLNHLDCVLVSNVIENHTHGISIYPVPSTGILRINGLLINDILTINVFNLAGQRVAHVLNPSKNEIEIKESGMFIVELITTNGKNFRQKIMIKK